MTSTVRALMLAALVLAPAAAEAQDPNFGSAAAIAGRDVLVGQPSNLYAPGLVYVYRAGAEGRWTEAARLAAPDSAMNDGFGRQLAVDGNTLLIAQSPGDSAAGAGAVHVYTRAQSGAWRRVGRFTAPDARFADRFARALALRGGVAAVGAPGADSGRGAVYLFRRAGDTWHQETVLRPRNAAPGTGFGAALSLAGDRLLVGAEQADSNAGAVWIFRRDGSSWSEEARLAAGQPAMAASAHFGAAVLLEDGVAYVGAPGLLQNMGAVLTFERDSASGAWQPRGRILPFDATPYAQFGKSIALVGGDLWVGAPGANQFEGRVFRMTRDTGGAWTGATKLAPDSAETQGGFGGMLVAGADRAVIGMPNADFGEGRAVLLSRTANGQWRQQSVSGQFFRPSAVAGREVSCTQNQAGIFGCENVAMLSLMPIADMGGIRGTRLNDVWGWTDPRTNREIAIVGRSDGVSFVDVTEPTRPRYLGNLPKTESSPPAVWRDMKVYKNHVFVVADGSREHGMQVFDLTRLRRVRAPQVFKEDAHYDRINSAHNIVIDTATGYAFITGASSGGETCGGGLHMVNIQDPKHPEFAGCFSDPSTGYAGTGYTHDAQCVVYHGPDARYTGRHICLGANENALSIADVTDKASPKAIGRGTYPNFGYAHQGWLSEDHRYFYLDDELDELQGKVDGTRTIIWDVSRLDDPVVAAEYIGPVKSSDHNLYIKGDRMYQSNYVSGLRVLDISDRTNPKQVGYFDTVPVGPDDPGFGGTWSNYPYFKSGAILVTSGKEGLFVLRDQETTVLP